jgi:hypothetical protein
LINWRPKDIIKKLIDQVTIKINQKKLRQAMAERSLVFADENLAPGDVIP